MINEILDEAQRLYAEGWGVHWIRQNSKAPVESGWANGQRQELVELMETVKPGYGLGVRLGAASKLKDDTFLANIDVDIKSADPKHEKQAFEKLYGLFPELANAPAVKTGYGFRFFFRTRFVARSKKLAQSDDKAKVRMPTAPITAEQKFYCEQGIVSQEELNAGIRVRPAWELEIMSGGRQVVLPPSIHPDTKLQYAWLKKYNELNDLPIVEIDEKTSEPVKWTPDQRRISSRINSGTRVNTKPGKKQFKFIPYDLALDERFTPHMVRLITGEDVHDRSAAAFSLAIAMLKGGFDEDEVISVLTDKTTFIGEMAFEHRKTKNREAAADWAYRYCVYKARIEANAAAAFENEVIIESGGLSEEAAAAQAKALVRVSERPWQAMLSRGGKDGDGAIKPTLENTLLIIRNVVSPHVFRKDSFSGREFYGTKAPWTGAQVGKALSDSDAIAIKAWLGPKFGMEPSTGIIFEAMEEIAAQNQFNPVQEELEALPAWDGSPRIDTWFAKYFNAEGPPDYLAQVFRKWLIGSITRTYHPGAKFDWMPILEGPQGVGKSVFGSILFGPKYFADWLPNLGDKDAALGLLGRRCVEFAELDRLRRNEVETVKAFVTRTVDVVRPPYGRKSVELPRSVVFFGTTNRERYLQDDTGNRRFCPVKVGALDWAAIERDRDQLWAEALVIYQLGLESSLYLEGAAVAAAKEIQKEKQVEDDSDAMAEILQTWVERELIKKPEERFDLSKFKLLQLFESCGPFGAFKFEMRNSKNASKALKKLGFSTFHTKQGNCWRRND